MQSILILGGFAKGNGTFNKEMICTDTRTYKFVVIEL